MSEKNTLILRPTNNFNNSAWSNEYICLRTNCYTFALGAPEAGRATPGNLNRQEKIRIPRHEFTTEKIRKRVFEDGLIEISEDAALSGKFHTLALRIDPDFDFDFCRLYNGQWYEKLSFDPVRKAEDNDRNLVINPRTASNDMHPEFGGFFTIPEKGIPFVQRLKF